jgi:tripartite-type tricarboxylate transporter receptor subunit TctC
MPDVPTLAESGVSGVNVPLWFGLLAPAGTPREVIQVLASGTARAARSPELRQKLQEQGAEPVGNTPDEFARLLDAEVASWTEVVKVSGAKVE